MQRVAQLLKATAPLTLTSSLLSVITAVVYDYVCTGTLKVFRSVLLIIGVLLLHLGVNLYNDYRDYVTKVDHAYRTLNVIHRVNMILDLGVTPSNVKRTSLIMLASATGIGLFLVLYSHALVALILAVAGIATGYLYSLIFRRSGVGEILAGLAVGPGIVVGALDILDNLRVSVVPPLIIGVVNGIYTTLILSVLAMARREADIKIGKRTVAVLLGERGCRTFSLILIGVAATCSIALALYIGSMVPLLTLPVLILAVRSIARLDIKRLFYCRIVHVSMLILSLL